MLFTKRKNILIFLFSILLNVLCYSQCTIQASVCQTGSAGPFNFNTTSGAYAGSSFANAGCATGNSGNHSYGFIRLFISQTGPLNLLINGNSTTGYIDVAIFNIPSGQNPCTAIQSASNSIGCNFASAASGCVQFGNAFPCSSSVPAPNVVAGQEIVIIAQNWSTPGSSNFTLQLGPAPSAQSGLPNTTITPVQPICLSAAPIQLQSQSGGGIWSGPGVSSSGLFNSSTSGIGSHSISYSLGISPCQSTSTTSITVLPNNNATFNQINPICQNDTPPLLPSQSIDNPPVSGTWSPATINTSNLGNSNYTFTPASGQCGSPYTMNIQIITPSSPTFTQIDPICQNGIAPNLPLTSSNNISGTWSPNFINLNSPGSSTYTFISTSPTCTQSTSMVINVIPIAAPAFTANVTTGCTPLNVSFSTPAIPNVSYNYSLNNNSFGTNPTANYSFTNEGCYDITLTANNNGCTQSTTIPDMICVETPPSVFFSASPTILENSSQQVVFSNNTIGGESYLWDFGDGSTSTDLNNTHLYSNINGNFNVSLTSTTSLGCTSSYLVTLTYIDKPVFYIPNTFTPDEDQFNQTWGPVFTSGFDPFNFDLYVYNRWGEIIWESHDAKERWDGSFGKKGLKVPSGIYSYKIRFKPTTTDEKVTVSGSINLMR